MTPKNQIAFMIALDNAAEMIRGHVESNGMHDEHFSDGITVDIYKKSCDKVYALLTKRADKLRLKIKS